MAARLWMVLFGADALLALWVVPHWVARCHGPPWLAVALGAAVLLAPWMLTCVEVLVLARPDGEVGWDPRLRAALSEPAHSAIAAIRVMVEPWRTDAQVAIAAGREPRPVLLIHGIVCNGGVWRGWLRQLQVAGFAPVRILTLEPLFADIDVHAARVARELEALQRECGGARVAILAHSMGGLVARAALRLVGPQTICQVITLACPHHGTQRADRFPSRPTRQMRLNSAWLAALNAAQEPQWPIPVMSLYSLDDHLVVPADSARLGNADCRVLRGVGHLGLLDSPEARQMVMTTLGAS